MIEDATLETRLQMLRTRISTALMGSQRKIEDITLIAVTKGHPASSIRALYQLGIRDFGESYTAEFIRKAGETADLTDIRWHFIGHLQSNKVRKIIDLQPLIQSLDRTSLLNELIKFADPARPQRLLLQLQIDPDDSNKFGCSRNEAEKLCQQLVRIPGLVWEGFMGIGPAQASTEKLNWLYKQFYITAMLLWEQYSLREPSRKVREAKISLGMSDDLEVALRSGSTMIRIGSALLGPRPEKGQAT